MVQTQHNEVAAVWGLEKEAWSQDTNMWFACLLDTGGTQLSQRCILLWEELSHLWRQFSASVSTAERGIEQGTSILVCSRFAFSQYLVLIFYNVPLLSCMHICISQGGKDLKDLLCFSSSLYSEPYQPNSIDAASQNSQSQIKQTPYEILQSGCSSALLGCASEHVFLVAFVQWLYLIDQESVQSVSWGSLLREADHIWLGVKAIVLSHPFSWLLRDAHLLVPRECWCIIHFPLQTC